MVLTFQNESESLVLTLPERLYRNASERPYEWNRVTVAVSAGAWKGQDIPANLTAEEILGFLRPLPGLFRSLRGAATLHPIEEGITLALHVDDLGRVEIRGGVKDADLGNRLEFRIRSDQSFFSEFPARVERYLANQD